MLAEVALVKEFPPLSRDEHGGLRVGNSRVLLELVLDAYQAGESPELIAREFPTLTLADIYGTIAFYLRHRQTVDNYLAARDALAQEVRQKIAEVQGDQSDLRAKLAARNASSMS